MNSWYAATTRAGFGQLSVMHLHRQGFEAFCPVVAETRIERGRRLVRKLMLFPGYVFVGLDVERDRWRSVNGTVGVGRILTFGETVPRPLPAGFVEELQGLQDKGELTAVRAECVVYHYAPHEQCVVNSGAWEGHKGEFVKYRKGSLILLMTLFGQKVELSFPPHIVSPAVMDFSEAVN